MRRPTETVTEPNYFLSTFSAFSKRCWTGTPSIRSSFSRNRGAMKCQLCGRGAGGGGPFRGVSGITRTTIRWGIPVPGEEPHVLLRFGLTRDGVSERRWRPEYMKNRVSGRDIHLVGKDYSIFTLCTAGVLMACGLPLPKTDFGAWLAFSWTRQNEQVRGHVVCPPSIGTSSV